MSQRKLIALDEDDLAVISAHVQDAAVVAGDIIWRQGEKRLVIGMRRPDWDEVVTRECEPRRLISALRFDRVLSCKSRDISGSSFMRPSGPAATCCCCFPTAACCGSMSKCWNANWPISALMISTRRSRKWRAICQRIQIFSLPSCPARARDLARGVLWVDGDLAPRH
jgi:hypothetical protein